MATYIVRAVATLRLVGIFDAKNSTHLFWLLDRERDPFGCEYLALQDGEGLYMDALFTGAMCEDDFGGGKTLRVDIEAVPNPEAPRFTDALEERLNRGRSWNLFTRKHFADGFNPPLSAIEAASAMGVAR